MRYAVQENILKPFSEKMLNNNSHDSTLLVMGVLIHNPENLRVNACKDLSSKFATVTHEENQALFKSLLAAKGPYSFASHAGHAALKPTIPRKFS